MIVTGALGDVSGTDLITLPSGEIGADAKWVAMTQRGSMRQSPRRKRSHQTSDC